MADSITRYTYPDYFVNHPNIGHHSMVAKLFPYLNPKQLSLDEYIRYYQATYTVLCKDFDNYIKYLEDEFFNKMKSSRNPEKLIL